MSRVILLITFFLIACGNTVVDDETAEKYLIEAENVIFLLNERKYDDLLQTFNRDFRLGVKEEGLKNLEPLIEKSGDFIEIERTSVEREQNYYVAILATKYTKEHRIFTIKFDRNDEIAELLVQ